jgi:2-polyprenyl-3-methyl-5-hydroxy-6-metoxy-1,4-benzoquinol methylase
MIPPSADTLYHRPMDLSLRKRRLEQELMDDPALEAERHFAALQGLERINRWSGSLDILWPTLSGIAREEPDRTLRVLDVGTGSGDIPIGLNLRAAQRRIRLRVDGCDRSERTVAYARKRAEQAGVACRFFRLDVLLDDLPADYHVILSSLFLHHLETEQAATLLERMAGAAGRSVLVSDLLRTRSGLLLAYCATRLLTTSEVVRADGPQSVRAAFTLDEVKSLAARARLDGCTVTTCRPCRFLLAWHCRTG